MNKVFKLLLVAIICLPVNLSAQGLKFHSNGKFKIIQVTDTHIRADSTVQTLVTVDMLNQVLEEEKPDLVIFSGDVVSRPSYKAAVDVLVEPVVSRKIHWAAVFGNHDRESDLSYEQMAELYDNYPYNVGKMKKLDGVDGYGNYTIEISASNSDRTEAVVYCLDTHTYVTLPDGKGDDAHITFNQINWYQNQSDNYTKANNGKPLQALTFFHIPLLEYRDAYLEDGHKIVGTQFENVCSPEINSGFFTAMMEKGDVMGVFVGHDHLNDYIFNRWGIALAYGRFSGNSTTYGFLKNGVRVIELTEGHHDFDTWIRLDSETVINKVNFPKDLPIKVRR
jgi:3',5'-cyclic AMP phosphodiesterase CpdA